MSLSETVTLSGHVYREGIIEDTAIEVSCEYHFDLKINGNPYMTIACSGRDLEFLALGHLMSLGIVQGEGDVHSVEVNRELGEIDVRTSDQEEVLTRLFTLKTIASGCGNVSGGSVISSRNRSSLSIDPHLIPPIMKEFLGLSEIHGKTHGVHSAALYTFSGERIAFFDEIGRHNAVDKLMGFALSQGINPGTTILVSTGRISSEIAQKALAGTIPVVMSRAAPTDRAIAMAREGNLLLLTGVRRRNYYIASGLHHLAFKE